MEVYSDCKAEAGITIGLIDSLIAIARVLVKRDMNDVNIQGALEDLRCDKDILSLLANKKSKKKPAEVVIIETSVGNVQLGNKFIKRLREGRELKIHELYHEAFPGKEKRKYVKFLDEFHMKSDNPYYDGNYHRNEQINYLKFKRDVKKALVKLKLK